MHNTQLLAIMFTDIVGYTALMQSDREQAMQAVKLHEATLRAHISDHAGALVQTYGDGTLSLFPSASAAVKCPKEMRSQKGFYFFRPNVFTIDPFLKPLHGFPAYEELVRPKG